MLCQLFFWPTKFARTTNMKIACDPRLRREVTAVARRQTYKTFGVGHNSFQEPRPAQEVTSCSRAARRTDRYSFLLQIHGEDMRGVVMGLTLFWCVCDDMCCDDYGVVCSFLRDETINAVCSTFSWPSMGCICFLTCRTHGLGSQPPDHRQHSPQQANLCCHAARSPHGWRAARTSHRLRQSRLRRGRLPGVYLSCPLPRGTKVSAILKLFFERLYWFRD